jgi:RNA polymerase sigma-70 factor (ECF subfamily)
MATAMRRFNPVTSATGDLDWDSIYTSELPRIFNFFRYRVGDGDLAEDLTASTFERAWKARGRYQRDRAAFSTWLFTIARTVATDHYRRLHDVLSVEEVSAEASGPTPIEASEREADFTFLSTLLAELAPREHELIAWKYGAGLSNREIARLASLSESNVGTILARVTARLRARWNQAAR